MFNVIDLSKYIISYSTKKLGRPINNLQLQKILYYVKGTVLAKHNVICFANDIVSWNYGPVVREAYDTFKIYGNYNILLTNEILYDRKGCYILNLLDSENPCLKETINDVINEKSKYTAWDLVKMTHNERPWKETTRNNNIDNTLLGESFEEINRNKIK